MPRNKIPYAKIAALYGQGKTDEQIAKAVGRFQSERPDPTKEIRGILSRMRTIGYENPETGKTIHLPARTKTTKAKSPKVAKAKAEKVAKAPKATGTGKRGRPKGSKNKPKETEAIVFALSDDGNMVRMTVPRKVAEITLDAMAENVEKLQEARSLIQAQAQAQAESTVELPEGVELPQAAETTAQATVEAPGEATAEVASEQTETSAA